jgi:hypothetical protein
MYGHDAIDMWHDWRMRWHRPVRAMAQRYAMRFGHVRERHDAQPELDV